MIFFPKILPKLVPKQGPKQDPLPKPYFFGFAAFRAVPGSLPLGFLGFSGNFWGPPGVPKSLQNPKKT